jgi:hypothetical protein
MFCNKKYVYGDAKVGMSGMAGVDSNDVGAKFISPERRVGDSIGSHSGV